MRIISISSFQKIINLRLYKQSTSYPQILNQIFFQISSFPFQIIQSILYQRLMSTILTERKRFNYNLNTTHNIRNSNSQKRLFTPTPINCPTFPNIRDENVSAKQSVQLRDQAKRIEELQDINKRLIQDTTLHFKKLESDVQRVEKILEEKELLIIQLQNQKEELKQGLNQTNQEKNILIEAIFEKDLVIKEYEAKIQQFLQRKQPSFPELSFERQTSTISVTVHLQDAQIQTDNYQSHQSSKNEAIIRNQRNSELEDELFEVKEELFDARNKIKLLTQQFEAYKILKQIQSIQQL